MKPRELVGGLMLIAAGILLTTAGIAAVGSWSALVIPGVAVGFWGGWMAGAGLGW